MSTDRFPGKRFELAVNDRHLSILELALQRLHSFEGRVDLQGAAGFVGLQKNTDVTQAHLCNGQHGEDVNGFAIFEEDTNTFWVAVLSSARQVAKFLAHWPSCIAAAWSATVGTADFADVTILLPG